MRNVVAEFIKLVGLSEEEVLRALISAFCPSSPGAIRQSWMHRKNYGEPPSTRMIWELWEDADFRCGKCGSQYRISLDHRDNNAMNSNVKNLQVLCSSCNRYKGKRVVCKDGRAKIVKAFLELTKKEKRYVTNTEIIEKAKIPATNVDIYLIKFLLRRIGFRKPMRGARGIPLRADQIIQNRNFEIADAKNNGREIKGSVIKKIIPIERIVRPKLAYDDPDFYKWLKQRTKRHG